MGSPSTLDDNDDLFTSSSPDRTRRSHPAGARFLMLTDDSLVYCRTLSDPSPPFGSAARDGNDRREPGDGHRRGAVVSEQEMMKERFSKLLLGEDMSGSGRGASTAVTISNSITNLYATVFGKNQRLEPLPSDRKWMWAREMDCLLSVCDFIVEFVPESQCLPDGTVFEVMSNRPRSDIQMNLPALRMLDALLLEILDSFREAEFWYAENVNPSRTSRRSVSFRRAVHRVDEKWWLPVPRVPPRGLSQKWRRHLVHKRECACQIHKAAMAINTSTLAEMEIPDAYLASLPKSGRASIGDVMYRYMWSGERFSPERLLECVQIGTEHDALELADRVEASMHAWRRKVWSSHSRSSWETVKEMVSDDRHGVLAERAERLLLCLKQRYPELSQTTMDACKIEHNKDVGKAVVESYSRVLEGLAFSVVGMIEDVLLVDGSVKSRQEWEAP